MESMRHDRLILGTFPIPFHTDKRKPGCLAAKPGLRMLSVNHMEPRIYVCDFPRVHLKDDGTVDDSG